MSNRPGQLCVLETGKLIDSQSNFVATFNWLVSSVSNLTGGTNCKVDWPADDTPTINVNDPIAPNGGGGGGGGDHGGVVSIWATDEENGITLNWEYADGTTDSKYFKTGSGGGGGGEGGDCVTSLNTLTGAVDLVSEDDCNVTFTTDTDSNKIKIGVYYV